MRPRKGVCDMLSINWRKTEATTVGSAYFMKEKSGKNIQVHMETILYTNHLNMSF